MYKGASRFWQGLGNGGRKPKAERPARLLASPPKSAQVSKLDRAAQEAKLRNWVTYIRNCCGSNVEPRVPEAVLAELRRRNLIP